MPQQPSQQGKPQPSSPDAPSGNVAQISTHVDAPETPKITPLGRAHKTIHDLMQVFHDNHATLAKDTRSMIAKALLDCPAAEFTEFRELTLNRAEKLKMFSELVYNEFLAQSSSMKK